jgi:hypothetical protein
VAQLYKVRGVALFLHGGQGFEYNAVPRGSKYPYIKSRRNRRPGEDATQDITFELVIHWAALFMPGAFKFLMAWKMTLCAPISAPTI